MRIKKQKAVLALAAAAFILAACSQIEPAWAYFTTYAAASGGKTLHIGSETEMEETFKDWIKHVSITNKEGSAPVFIRAKAFCGKAHTLSYSGELWEAGDDGWYYYQVPLEGGVTANDLLVRIDGVESDDTQDFKVAVVYEQTPALYEADGTPYADWDLALLIKGEGGGGNEE